MAKARAIALTTRWCKACGICIEFCPRQVFGADPLTGLVRVEHPEACTGCRLCEMLCPDYVITVTEAEEKEEAA